VANEDAIYHEVRPTQPGCVRAALAVADGESDEASGALASEIVLRKFRAGAEHAAQDPDIEPSRLLVHLCGRSHEAIRAACDKQHTTGNPRASFVGAYIVDNSLVVARAGNALAFLLRNGLIQAIGTETADTQDTPLAEHARPVTEAEPEPALIGGGRTPDVSVFPGEDSVCPLRDGDAVILCSDGLASALDAGKLGEVLHRTRTIEEACELLASLAIVKGSRDNVSIVCAEVGQLARVSRAQADAPQPPLPVRPLGPVHSEGIPLGRVAAAAAAVLLLVTSVTMLQRSRAEAQARQPAGIHETTTPAPATDAAPAVGRAVVVNPGAAGSDAQGDAAISADDAAAPTTDSPTPSATPSDAVAPVPPDGGQDDEPVVVTAKRPAERGVDVVAGAEDGPAPAPARAAPVAPHRKASSPSSRASRSPATSSSASSRPVIQDLPELPRSGQHLRVPAGDGPSAAGR